MHHILAEIIQGGLVLETNVEEIDASGMSLPFVFSQYPAGTPLRPLFIIWVPIFLSTPTHLMISATGIKIQEGIIRIRKSSFIGCRRRSWPPRREPEDTSWLADWETNRSWSKIELILGLLAQLVISWEMLLFTPFMI